MNVRLTFTTLWMALTVALVGCAAPALNHRVGKAHNLPPAQQLLEPGPGVGGPGPGVLPPLPPPPMMAAPAQMVQILFAKPDAMQVRWDISGSGYFDSVPLVTPGRHNFPEGGIYRLKLTNIPGRVGVELYPTIEIGPTTPRSAAYLAHNAIPMQFTEEDFDQVLSGNFVTKVIYLPDPEFQELALAGVETLVSTRLDPGIDPIVEADRRGAIMAIIRLGNKDIEVPEFNGSAEVITAGYFNGPGGPVAMAPLPITGGGNVVPNYVAGVTSPHYGMPMSGTPIGLPGPPHIPFGSPAGLQRHTMKNHTQFHLPRPTEQVKIHVQQRPGFSYPKPPSHVFIQEQTIHPAPGYHQPLGDMFQRPHPQSAHGPNGGACPNCR